MTKSNFDIKVFEKATDLMAMWLMRFREGDPNWDGEPSENDRLSAGLLAGSLSANNLLVEKMPDQTD